jgi:hypothetical protein
MAIEEPEPIDSHLLIGTEFTFEPLKVSRNGSGLGKEFIQDFCRLRFGFDIFLRKKL